MSFSLKKVYIPLIILFLSFLAGAYIVFAQNSTLSKITYPIAELGSCASQQECQTYCSKASNYSKCAAFAQKVGLTVEVSDDKKGVFAAMQKGEGPGGCKDEASCRKYCESTNIDNIKECLAFAEKFNLVSPDELKEMRQMAAVKQTGAKFPGNCKTKESCLAYCENSTHQVECMEFAQKAGFIPNEDAGAISKILPYLKSGGKVPGGCTTKESCDAYCASDTHTNECMDFAVKAGFMTKEDADIVRKTGGKGPGNCRSREACDNYCKQNKDECIKWAKDNGLDRGAEECGKQGGSWDGKQCNFSNKGITDANECAKQGGSWDGKQCDFSQKKGAGVQDAGECSKQGGDWNGKQCDFSRKGGSILDPDGCSKQGGAWNNGRCDFSKKGVGITDGGECSKQGGSWDGKQCDFSKKGPGPVGDQGAVECAKQGGIPNGKQCDFSKKGGGFGINDAGECSKQGGIWDGKLCDFSKKGVTPQTPQKYPLLLQHLPFSAILNFFLGR